jgi:hypothetical protein
VGQQYRYAEHATQEAFSLARPVKWSRDVHPIRERAARSRTETWSRQDIERLFGISRASAQNLMKAIGEVQAVGGTHFVGRASLLSFLDQMTGADSVDTALRSRHEAAESVPRPSPLRISLPEDLRRVTLRDMPDNVMLSPGEIRVTGANAERILEGLLVLAQVMQNDLDSVRARLDAPAGSQHVDEELRTLLATLRRTE